MKESEEEYTQRVSEFVRVGLLMSGAYNPGDIVTLERTWTDGYACLPRKTISGKWLWLTPIFVRRVWRANNNRWMSPSTEYGTIFDLVKE